MLYSLFHSADDWSAICAYLDAQFLLAFHSPLSASSFTGMRADYELRIVEEARHFFAKLCADELATGNSIKCVFIAHSPLPAES